LILSALYILLSLATLVVYECPSGVCNAPDVLGHTLYSLGVVYYVLTAHFVVSVQRRSLVMAWLGAGVLVHFILLLNGGIICHNCMLFAAMHIILTTTYSIPRWYEWIESIPFRRVILIFSCAVASIVMIVLLVAHFRLSVTYAEPVVVQAVEPYYLETTDMTNTQVVINLKEKPALVFAAWCDHCDEALRNIARLEPDKRPYLVVTFLRDEDNEKAREKLKENGLTDEKFYLTKIPPGEIESVPALVWWDRELKRVSGTESIVKILQFPKLIGRAEVNNPLDSGAVNAALAASFMNDTVVRPGEVFSFNSTVGPRTVDKGYVEGGSVVQNTYGEFEVVPDVGGGVCRLSTALHHAVLDAGLEVVEHSSHGLTVSYAAPGMDAAVYYNTLDYKWKNTTSDNIKIVVKTVGEKLIVELWDNPATAGFLFR